VIPRTLVIVAAATLGIVGLTGCVSGTGQDAAGTTVHVISTATECTLSANTAPRGTVVFSVTNSGDSVTEFYVLADDGNRAVGEVENIGPGITRDVRVEVQAGEFFTLCKPGMVGDGVGKARFTVTDTR
jgi:iron uptake system component EfeO